MSKFEIPSVLSRVRVGSPCQQDWNTMRGNDKVRFCDHCAKNVHNLSEMTPDAALELVEQSEGRLCVRYISNPDGSPHVKDDVEPLSGGVRMPNLRLAAGVLSAALTFGVGVPVTPAQTPAAVTQADGKRLPLAGTGTLVVTVTDPTGAVITWATVTVKHTKTGWTATVQTDDNGNATFREIDPGFYIVKSTAEHFNNSPQLSCEVGPTGVAMLSCALSLPMLTGDVVCVSPARMWLDHADERNRLENVFETENPDADFNGFPDRELFEAAEDADVEALQKLLADGGNSNARNRFGDTLLMKALENGDEDAGEIIEVLLDAKADVNLSNRFGVTPLMYAALQDAKLVGQLLDAEANVNAADDNGRTALMFAAFDGKLDVVRLLVRSGADVNARDAKGQSVLSYALAGGDVNERKALIKLLKKAGAVE